MRSLRLCIATSLALVLNTTLVLAAEGNPPASGAPGATESKAPAETTAQPVQGTVTRAVVTTGVQNLEPVDALTTVSNDHTKVYYFTEIHGLQGQAVKHRWEHAGQVMAEVEFQIGGPRWRVYSSKTLEPSWLGDWKVSVIDSNGNPLSVNTFSYTNAAASSSTAPAPPAKTQ
jgi:hypothetical protein